MKKKLYVPLITMLLLGLTTSLFAGEKVDQSKDVGADGVVQIANVRGIIRVEGWDENQVSVKGELDDMAKSLIFKTNGTVTNIEVEMPKGRLNRGDGSNLIVRVPRGHQVDFEGVSSDFVVENVKEGVDIRTVSGDVDAKGIEKSIYIKTVSGDVKVKESSGDSRLASVSGDIKAEMDSESIETNVVSGDVTLHLGNFKRLDASVVNGEFWVKGAQMDDGETSVSSVNGDVTLNFTAALNARIKAKTGPGGNIHNEISSDEVEKVFPNQEKLKCTVGDGNGKVVVSTVNGTIKIKGD